MRRGRISGFKTMIDRSKTQKPNLSDLAGKIVTAYVSNNSVPAADLPDLIGSIHSAIAGLTATNDVEASTDMPTKPTPAQIRASIRQDGIVSFIDGRSYKVLKRHLRAHGLDPRSYRERYQLPADYPMVPAGYATRRSALAKAIGLGRFGGIAEHMSRRDTAA